MKTPALMMHPFPRSQFKLFPGVPEPIRLRNDLGLGRRHVSNPPGIAQQRTPEPEVLNDHSDSMMLSGIRAAGGRIRWNILLLSNHGCQRPQPTQAFCHCRKT